MSRRSFAVYSLLAVLLIVVLLLLPISAFAAGGICNRIEIVRTRNGVESNFLLYEDGTWYGEGTDNRIVYVDPNTNFEVWLWRSGGTSPWTFRLIGPGWDSGDQSSTGSFRVFSPPMGALGNYLGRVDVDSWKSFLILQKDPDPGTIRVRPNLSNAGWKLYVGSSLITSGTGNADISAPSAIYRIEWQVVPGYDTPPSETEYLPAGGSITFYGNYQIQPEDPPTADFTSDVTSCCDPLTVHFTDLSTAGSNAIVSWYWQFGDGATSTSQNPSHTYSDGIYTVSLTVTDAHSYSDSETKDAYITSNEGPTADFSANPTSGDAPLEVDFSDNSVPGDNPIVSWYWEFGNGDTSTVQNPSYTYNTADTYTVTLTVTDGHGCSDTETKTITVTNPNPLPKFKDYDVNNYYESFCGLTGLMRKMLLEGNTLVDATVDVLLENDENTEKVELRFSDGQTMSLTNEGGGKWSRRVKLYPLCEPDTLEIVGWIGALVAGLCGMPGPFVPPVGTCDYDSPPALTEIAVTQSSGATYLFTESESGSYLPYHFDTIVAAFDSWSALPFSCSWSEGYVAVMSPVDLHVIDPDGLVITKDYSEVGDALYWNNDYNEDGDPEEFIIIENIKQGRYTVTVIPEQGAAPTDTYTLKVSVGDTTLVLAEDVQISETPEQGYIVESTETGIRQVPSLELCFIATAAYGTPMAEEIQILRDFRDQYLLTNPFGQAFIHLYYKFSPPIANFITDHPNLKPIVRLGLVPVVAVSTVVVNTTAVEKIAILGLLMLVSVALAIWMMRRRGSGPQHT